MLASINGTDISKFIQETSYKMDQVSVYDEWTDGNYTVHHDEKRKRVEGSFDLAFVKESDLQAFISLVDANTSDGALAITLYIVNKDTTKECHVFFTMESTKTIKINSTYNLYLFSCEVEEK